MTWYQIWKTLSESDKSLSSVRLFATPWTVAYRAFQARILECIAISFSRRSSQPRDWTLVSHIVGFTALLSEPPGKSENPEDLIKKLLGLINKCIEVSKYKMNTKNSVVSLQ